MQSSAGGGIPVAGPGYAASVYPRLVVSPQDRAIEISSPVRLFQGGLVTHHYLGIDPQLYLPVLGGQLGRLWQEGESPGDPGIENQLAEIITIGIVWILIAGLG